MAPARSRDDREDHRGRVSCGGVRLHGRGRRPYRARRGHDARRRRRHRRQRSPGTRSRRPRRERRSSMLPTEEAFERMIELAERVRRGRRCCHPAKRSCRGTRSASSAAFLNRFLSTPSRKCAEAARVADPDLHRFDVPRRPALRDPADAASTTWCSCPWRRPSSGSYWNSRGLRACWSWSFYWSSLERSGDAAGRRSRRDRPDDVRGAPERLHERR